MFHWIFKSINGTIVPLYNMDVCEQSRKDYFFAIVVVKQY